MRFAFTIAVVMTAATAISNDATTRQPNVIVVMADDISARDFPMYGSSTPGGTSGGRTPMYGSQTPMYDAGSRTPHYGSMTPSHGTHISAKRL